MSDRQPADDDLMRLFERARTDLPSEAFVERLERRLAQARRTRLGAQIALLALLVAAAALMACAAQWLPQLGLALDSPTGWAGSLLLGAWVLKRAHVFER